MNKYRTGAQFISYHVLIILSIILGLLFAQIFFNTPARGQQEAEIGPADVIEELKKEIEAKTEEIEELREKANAYNQSLGEQREKRIDLQNQVYIYNLRIGKVENDILLTEAGIEETELTIRKLKFQIETKENELIKEKELLVELLRLVYENDQQGFFEIILKNENLSDFFNQIESTTILQESIQTGIETIHVIKDQLEREKTNQEDKKIELEELEGQLSDQKDLLEGERGRKNKLLKDTRNQEKRFQSLLSEVRKQQEEIAREVELLEDKLRFTIDPSSIPEFGDGVLGWPNEGILTQGYGSTSDTGFKNHVYSFHNGIDIAAGYGAPIRAAENGRVTAMGDDGKYAYGKWIAIDHENGLITMYAHMSFRKTSIGQEVERGEVIGYEGATGFSTGSHLHFTVYASQTFKTKDRWYGLLPLGGSIDPFNYL